MLHFIEDRHPTSSWSLEKSLAACIAVTLAGCGAGSDSAKTATVTAATSPAAGATDSSANVPSVAISTKAPLSSSVVIASASTKLTPLQVVQKIFHDQVDWYPGNNDPYSPAVRSWAEYAATNWFTSSRTFEEAYAATQAAIVADARRFDSRIPPAGHPFPRATYNAPTLSWMTELNTINPSLSPLQVVQKIFHDQVDWYPGNNDPYSPAVRSWAEYAATNWFTSSRSFEEAYAGMQAAIVADARRFDSRIPSAGHPYPRAIYNAPTLPWMSAALDTGTSTPSAPSASTVNSVNTIVNDMKLRNDAVLRGYENRTNGWYVGPGHVNLGNTPRLSHAPLWWQSANPGRASSDKMRAVLPWMVIFDGAGHNAWNTRVQIRNYRAYYKSLSSGTWVMLGSSAGASGAVYGKTALFGAMTAENRRTNADGSSEIKPPSDINFAWHGWWDRGRVTIPPDDIAALFVTLQARLVVDNASQSDDRANARYLVQVGADYYSDLVTNWAFVVPAAAISRSKLVTNTWQSFSATTFSDVGVQDPGGGISEAAFRAAPPPLE